MNSASKWRLQLANRVADSYSANPKVAAVIVGGSAGRGHADRFSDLEIGVFWREPPTDEDRLAAASATGGNDIRLYPYDPAEEAWEDDLFLGHLAPGQPYTGLLVEIPHYTVDFIERVLDDVLERYDPSDAKQNLLAAITTSKPLYGQELIEAWRSRAAVYPRELALAMVKKHAQIDHFWRTEMFLERGNNLMLLNDTFVQVSKKLLYVLFALNRTYYSGFKWLDLQLSQMEIVPPNFSNRLREVYQAEPRIAIETMRTLVEETYSLIEREMPEIDIEWLRLVFRYRRQPWDQPPPGAL